MSTEFLSPHYGFYYPDLTMWGGCGNNAFGARDATPEKVDVFIDMSSQWGVLALGYNEPRLVKAMVDQLYYLAHVCGTDFRHRPMEKLAEALVKRMPPNHEWRVFFTNSGAESVEGAIKLARYYNNKEGFLSLINAFHGRTTGAMSLGATATLHKHLFGKFLGRVSYLACDSLEYLKVLESVVYLAREEISAMFIEPVQGVGGCNVISSEFMAEFRNFCTRNDILMVVDEVQSGCGRTGKFWAFEHGGVIPDIVCSAKALGGGLPLGAVIAKKEICTWPKGAHGSTFGGNPAACAAGLKLLEIMDDKFLEEVREKSTWFKKELQERLSFEVKGLGFMLGVNMPSVSFRDEVMKNAYEKNLLMATGEPAAIRLLPPLNTPKKVLGDVIDILIKSIERTMRNDLFKNQNP